MADVIVMAEAVKVTGTAGQSTRQSITEAIDVSAYEQLDLQLTLFAGTSGGSGVTVTILTSMQNKSDDPSWVPIGPSSTLFPINLPRWVTLSTSGSPLLRYVRYQINFLTSTTDATISIVGLARRKAT